ncbi:LAS superfamily LD-carboxypeptidase LdcB [Janibacter cremeus]|uniref:LAS superfamily LD-carboxypeptidase LdcB n=1 Tax=Janibacter cremeus TaxID=1285192 RepID=A0A852VHP8_9MICO|nr:LAS superfamily LD-carboxypeptidase LdcB [Janibacter cremeus]
MTQRRRRPNGTVWTVVGLCLSAGIAFAPPALATGPSDDPSPSTAWSADNDPGEGDHGTPLSEKSLDEQVAEAERLSKSLTEDNKEIAAAVKGLEKYSKRVNTLLQRQAEAREKYEQAKRDVDKAQTQLEHFQERLAEGEADLRDWAFETYTQSGGYNDTLELFGTLAKAPDSGSNSAGDLRYLTNERIRSVDVVQQETDIQAELTKRKESAVREASQAKNEAAQAKDDADEVLQERKASLDELREKHSEDLANAGPVITALIGQPNGAAQGASEQLSETLQDLGQDVSEFEGAEPCSTNTMSYPNGQIPPAALCPLLGAPSESLRPQAAAAFNSMSLAYQRDTGHLLCVTDSYRSYANQVVTKASRGQWAAAPGTSNHGVGMALDLCGGVNSFGHPAHLWMQQNAPLYGWFHPSWAAAGGSLPEPWHWEFSG